MNIARDTVILENPDLQTLKRHPGNDMFHVTPIFSLTDPSLARGAMAKFTLPVIHDNRNGWGPSHVPEQFKDTPYQPFSKGDRLGKVSTLTAMRTTSWLNFWVYRWLILQAVYTRIEGLQVRLTIVSRGQTVFLIDFE